MNTNTNTAPLNRFRHLVLNRTRGTTIYPDNYLISIGDHVTVMAKCDVSWPASGPEIRRIDDKTRMAIGANDLVAWIEKQRIGHGKSELLGEIVSAKSIALGRYTRGMIEITAGEALFAAIRAQEDRETAISTTRPTLEQIVRLAVSADADSRRRSKIAMRAAATRRANKAKQVAA